MNNKKLLTIAATGVSALGAGMFVYGMLFESKNLKFETFDIELQNLPERLNGFKIGVLSDFHLGHEYSVQLATSAIDQLLDAEPDVIVILGDFVNYWKSDQPRRVGEVLEPLLIMDGRVIAIPGNHDYHKGSPEILRVILDELNIKLLRNGSWLHQGIRWVGIDSINEGHDDIEKAFLDVEDEPVIVLWHEPDQVHRLPKHRALLQLSGHSHGGQFRFPYGLVPMTSQNGKKYKDGFYPDAETPLFVSRGVGTTGPPSRFLCPPQVAMLTLRATQALRSNA